MQGFIFHPTHYISHKVLLLDRVEERVESIICKHTGEIDHFRQGKKSQNPRVFHLFFLVRLSVSQPSDSSIF